MVVGKAEGKGGGRNRKAALRDKKGGKDGRNRRDKRSKRGKKTRDWKG
jgi:hypothetical protein